MRTHNGMRPQDVAVLVTIASHPPSKPLLQKDVANALKISVAEVSESLSRSALASLWAPSQRAVNTQGLLEFLRHGFRYVFPPIQGPPVRGVPTAHSGPPLDKHFQISEAYVWPHPQGTHRGVAIQPLYPAAPDAALASPGNIHPILALLDAVRIGRNREREMALDIINRAMSK